MLKILGIAVLLYIIIGLIYIRKIFSIIIKARAETAAKNIPLPLIIFIIILRYPIYFKKIFKVSYKCIITDIIRYMLAIIGLYYIISSIILLLIK